MILDIFWVSNICLVRDIVMYGYFSGEHNIDRKYFSLARLRDIVTIDRSVGTTLGMSRWEDKLTRISGAATLSGALGYSRIFVLTRDVSLLGDNL